MQRLVFLPSILLFSVLLILVGCTPGALPADRAPAPTIATPDIAPTAAAATSTMVNTATMTATTVTLPTGTPVITATSVSTATPPVTGTTTVTAPTGGDVGTCTWKAIHNLQPPGPATLTVSGVCTMPTPGYTLTLSRAEPQGINPAILLLNLTVAAPTGIVTQVVTPTEVVYTEETDQPFDQVTILADEGMGGNVDVEEVQ